MINNSHLDGAKAPGGHYHFVAIGGIGMSALARIALERGATVTGSDIVESAITKGLKKAGASIFIGHREENLPPSAVVVYSTAMAGDNPELKRAKELGYPLMHRATLLAEWMRSYLPLLIAGTHGKTTTSSLLAHVLTETGALPTFAVGGIIHSMEKNGGAGRGPYFVAEACESDGTFLHYRGYGGIITNIDNDHLDYWKEMPALIDGFRIFADQMLTKDHLFVCADDPTIRSMNMGGISYGFDPSADVRISNFVQEEWTIRFDLFMNQKYYPKVELPLVGRHNALNAAAVFALILSLKIPADAIYPAFLSFRGIGRRMEKKGEVQGVTIYDDYGHHPTEIATTLEGVRAVSRKGRLVVVFQPHRFTRTRDCMEAFGGAFMAADIVYITDIYSAGEKPIPDVNIQTLLACVRRVDQRRSFVYIPRSEVAQILRAELRKDDTLITLGAGDITKVAEELLALE